MSPQGDGKAEKENPTTIVNSNQRILPTYVLTLAHPDEIKKL